MRTRQLLEVLRERELPFEIVGGGLVPGRARSLEYRAACHISDGYLLVALNGRWVVEFHDSTPDTAYYVCRVECSQPDDERVAELFESVLDHRSFAWCPVLDAARDELGVALAPPAPPPPRPRPTVARRLPWRMQVLRWLARVRENAALWRSGLLARTAWLLVGVGFGLCY